MAPQTGGGGGGTGSSIGDIKNLTAFLIAGFAGVLNVIGLKSAEIGVVLRNDESQVIVIALFLVFGIVLAVVSIFIPSNLNLVQCVLLILSILCTSLAAYKAVQAEAGSQQVTVAEIGDDLQVNRHYDTLTLSISASKLGDKDWLGVSVFAVPRRKWNIKTVCALRGSAEHEEKYGLACQGDPCYYFHWEQRRTCPQLSGNVIAPNAFGGVQRTITVLISPKKFKYVQAFANTCTPVRKPIGKCKPSGISTRLDVAIPKTS